MSALRLKSLPNNLSNNSKTLSKDIHGGDTIPSVHVSWGPKVMTGTGKVTTAGTEVNTAIPTRPPQKDRGTLKQAAKSITSYVRKHFIRKKGKAVDDSTSGQDVYDVEKPTVAVSKAVSKAVRNPSAQDECETNLIKALKSHRT